MPKPTTAADAIPVRVVIVTLDDHLASATERAQATLRRELPGLVLTLHAAAEWEDDADALERCRADIARGDIVIATMLFMEDHIRAVLPALQARRDQCDAMLCCMSAGEVMRLTRVGRFAMDGKASGPMALLKRLRGGRSGAPASGQKQMAMLRRLPRLLRFIPGTAQDVRAYFLTLQYWLAGSDENVASMVRFLLDRYADGQRRKLRGTMRPAAPVEYPEIGVYHPRLPGRIAERGDRLPAARDGRPAVGLLVMRSYVLAGNTAHYDGVIAALEARGLAVVPAFASGLDARPAVERLFLDRRGRPLVDAVVSLTGFSLVGGPAYNDAKAAEAMLAALDVPYLTAQAVEFQTLEQWREGERGLMPIEATIMVAIPELDGGTGSLLFGGRSTAAACAWIIAASAWRSAAASGGWVRQRSRLALRSSRPR
jgi:magnesium chelatase subunit H